MARAFRMRKGYMRVSESAEAFIQALCAGVILSAIGASFGFAQDLSRCGSDNRTCTRDVDLASRFPTNHSVSADVEIQSTCRYDGSSLTRTFPLRASDESPSIDMNRLSDSVIEGFEVQVDCEKKQISFKSLYDSKLASGKIASDKKFDVVFAKSHLSLSSPYEDADSLCNGTADVHFTGRVDCSTEQNTAKVSMTATWSVESNTCELEEGSSFYSNVNIAQCSRAYRTNSSM